MTKTKKSIGLGIVFAVIALAISLMCITASYAKTNDSNEQNLVKTFTIDTSASDEVDYNFVLTQGVIPLPEGCSWEFNKTEKRGTFTFVDGVEKYHLEAIERDPNLALSFKYNETDYKASISAVFDPDLVAFDGYFGVPSSDITEQTFNFQAIFSDPTKPKVFDSVTVSGKTGLKNAEGEFVALPGVTLRIVNEVTNKIYGSTVSDNNGSYVFSNIDKTIITEASDPDDIKVYGCAPSFSISDRNPGGTPSRIVNKVAYFDDVNLQFHKADVSVIGDSHHQDFLLNMEASVAGEVVQSRQYLLPCYGIDNDQISKGASFNIATNGEFIGYAKTVDKGVEVDVSLSCVPISKDGSSFDRFELDGNKYLAGDSFSLDGNSQHEGVVYYSAIPQTGDAIPYAVVIGLGVIALVAFGICRKQFN